LVEAATMRTKLQRWRNCSGGGTAATTVDVRWWSFGWSATTKDCGWSAATKDSTATVAVAEDCAAAATATEDYVVATPLQKCEQPPWKRDHDANSRTFTHETNQKHRRSNHRDLQKWHLFELPTQSFIHTSLSASLSWTYGSSFVKRELVAIVSHLQSLI